jgi:hypothetical protein
MKRKTKQQLETEACAAFLCLDYLKTILPPERIATIGYEIFQEFIPYKTRKAKLGRLERVQSTNVALILERLYSVRGTLHLNARIIQKMDRHPLKHIVDPSYLRAFSQDTWTEPPSKY